MIRRGGATVANVPVTLTRPTGTAAASVFS